MARKNRLTFNELLLRVRVRNLTKIRERAQLASIVAQIAAPCSQPSAFLVHDRAVARLNSLERRSDFSRRSAHNGLRRVVASRKLPNAAQLQPATLRSPRRPEEKEHARPDAAAARWRSQLAATSSAPAAQFPIEV